MQNDRRVISHRGGNAFIQQTACRHFQIISIIRGQALGRVGQCLHQPVHSLRLRGRRAKKRLRHPLLHGLRQRRLPANGADHSRHVRHRLARSRLQPVNQTRSRRHRLGDRYPQCIGKGEDDPTRHGGGAAGSFLEPNAPNRSGKPNARPARPP